MLKLHLPHKIPSSLGAGLWEVTHGNKTKVKGQCRKTEYSVEVRIAATAQSQLCVWSKHDDSPENFLVFSRLPTDLRAIHNSHNNCISCLASESFCY